MSSKLLALCLVLIAWPFSASAQIIPNNTYSQMLVNSNALLQNSISSTIASQAQTNALGGGAGGAPKNYCSPLPPADLQRGMDGHVPPELQGDPRYQEWLRCNKGQNVPPAYAPPVSSTPVGAHHLPITITDFEPAARGHPIVEQYLGSQPFNNQQKDGVRIAFMEMTSRIGKAGRPNNLASAMAAAICGAMSMLNPNFTDADSDRYYVAINDTLGASPALASMSRLQKQNLSDALILQITIAKLLADEGQRVPQARAQSLQLARSMLIQLTGSPNGDLKPPAAP